jgi:hypothetical protein
MAPNPAPVPPVKRAAYKLQGSNSLMDTLGFDKLLTTQLANQRGGESIKGFPTMQFTNDNVQDIQSGGADGFTILSHPMIQLQERIPSKDVQRAFTFGVEKIEKIYNELKSKLKARNLAISDADDATITAAISTHKEGMLRLLKLFIALQMQLNMAGKKNEKNEPFLKPENVGMFGVVSTQDVLNVDSSAPLQTFSEEYQKAMKQSMENESKILTLLRAISGSIPLGLVL